MNTAAKIIITPLLYIDNLVSRMKLAIIHETELSLHVFMVPHIISMNKQCMAKHLTTYIEPQQ